MPRATRGRACCSWPRSWPSYEGGVLWLGGDQAARLRNGADAWMRWGLEMFGVGHVLAAPLDRARRHVGLDLVALGRPAGRPGHASSSEWRSRAVSSRSCSGSSAATSGRSSTGSACSFRSRSRPHRSRRSSRSSARGFTRKCCSGSGCSSGCTHCCASCACRSSSRCRSRQSRRQLAFAAAHHIGPYGEPMRTDLLRLPHARGAVLHGAVRRSRVRNRGRRTRRVRRARRRERDGESSPSWRLLPGMSASPERIRTGGPRLPDQPEQRAGPESVRCPCRRIGHP